MENKRPKVIKVKINDLLNASQAAILKGKYPPIPTSFASIDLNARAIKSARIGSSD